MVHRVTAATRRCQAGAAGADLLSALVFALLALAAMGLALRLESPGRALTAPGLLPFLTGASLLVMAASLGIKALRAGAWRSLRTRVSASAEDATRRAWTLALIGIITVYVLLIAWTSFELRIPMGGAEFLISSYEVFSVAAVALILKLFWRGAAWRCLLIALLSVEVLASAFRYGFAIPMPASF
jgi:hypothetical protein